MLNPANIMVDVLAILACVFRLTEEFDMQDYVSMIWKPLSANNSCRILKMIQHFYCYALICVHVFESCIHLIKNSTKCEILFQIRIAVVFKIIV